MEMQHSVDAMDSSNILVAGVGGIGCSWAKQAHVKCRGSAHLVLIDADDSSFTTGEDVHVLRLGHALDSVGCAALPAAGRTAHAGPQHPDQPVVEFHRTRDSSHRSWRRRGHRCGTRICEGRHGNRAPLSWPSPPCPLNTNQPEWRPPTRDLSVSSTRLTSRCAFPLTALPGKPVNEGNSGKWEQNGLKTSSTDW